MKLSAPITPRLADVDAERVRRELDLKIRELQASPAAAAVVLHGIQLASGVATVVNHNLGRAPAWIRESCIRTLDGSTPSAGVVTEIRDGSIDRGAQLKLMANGYGTTVIVDLAVM